jgi:hypothetical protein
VEKDGKMTLLLETVNNPLVRVLTAIVSISTYICLLLGLTGLIAPYVGFSPFALRAMVLLGGVLGFIFYIPPSPKVSPTTAFIVASYCLFVSTTVMMGVAAVVAPYMGFSPGFLQGMVFLTVILVAPFQYAKALGRLE